MTTVTVLPVRSDAGDETGVYCSSEKREGPVRTDQNLIFRSGNAQELLTFNLQNYFIDKSKKIHIQNIQIV